MPIKRLQNLEDIKEWFLRLDKEFKANKPLKHLDSNIEIEIFFRDLLNEIFDWSLENANWSKQSNKSQDTFDLYDQSAKVPEYHKQACIYPVYTLLSIIAAAHLAGASHGQKDLAVFAKSLSQSQRAALGIRRKAGSKHYSSPDQSTFSRMMSSVDIDKVEAVMIEWQSAVRGEPAEDELVVIDGKIPKHSGGKNVVTAITSPSQHYLGLEILEDKTNEITAARELFKKLDLDGKRVSLDAMHTQKQTAGELVLEHGADYFFTVKGNQPNLSARIKNRVSEPDKDSPFLSPNSQNG